MRSISIILVLGMFLGIGAAESVDFTFTGTTTGATYIEKLSLNLDPNDKFSSVSTYSMDNLGGMMSVGSMQYERLGNSMESKVLFTQDLYYTKSIEYYVDPHMHNNVIAYNSNLEGQWFMGSSLSGVQMGMDFTAHGGKGARVSICGFSTDEYFQPIFKGTAGSGNFMGVISFKDKFTFDRVAQMHTGAIQFGYTK